MIDVNGNHHVLSNEQGQFIPEKADTSALNAVVSALGSVTVAGDFSTLDVSDDEDLVDMGVGTYLVLATFHVRLTQFPIPNDVSGHICLCNSDNTVIDSMLYRDFAIPSSGTYTSQDFTMIAAVVNSATRECHVEYREASGGTYANANIKVVYVKLK